MTVEHACWKSEPWMCQEMWLDCIHGPDLWRMINEPVEIVTAGCFYPELPCLDDYGCDGYCDFCGPASDGMLQFQIPVVIQTVPAFHGLIHRVPPKLLSKHVRPGEGIHDWTPFETEPHHCGLFVIVNEQADDPLEGEYGQTRVAADLEVYDECFDGSVLAVLPQWAIPVVNLERDLMDEVYADLTRAESIVEQTIEARDIDLIWQLQELSSVQRLKPRHQELWHDWRGFLREAGDECSSSQSR